MSCDIRRNAIRRYGRSQATGFFFGFICLTVFFLLAGTNRNSIVAILGQTTWLWFFGIGAFASFLFPPTIIQWHTIRDAWLYCPNCGNFIASILAVMQLNKKSTCNRCGCEIEIAPVNKRQARFDMIYIVGGLWTVVGIAWFMFRMIAQFTPTAG